MGTGCWRTSQNSRDAARGHWQGGARSEVRFDTARRLPPPSPTRPHLGTQPGPPVCLDETRNLASNEGLQLEGSRVACTPCWHHVGQMSQVVSLGWQRSRDLATPSHHLGPLFQRQNGTSALARGTNQKVLGEGGGNPGTWSIDTPESLHGSPVPPPGAPDPQPCPRGLPTFAVCEAHRNYGRATSGSQWCQLVPGPGAACTWAG